MLRRLIHALALVAVVGMVSAGTASPAMRVVGGTVIQVQSAPWAVFISYAAGSTEIHCSGSVINATHVLTDAHCLYVPGSASVAQPGQVSVKAGVSNFSSPAPTDAEQDRSVSSFRVHPGYVSNGTEVPDDVAVLTLASPLDLSGSAVKAVGLPSPNGPFPVGIAVVIAGFGQQDPTADPNGELKSMTATTEPQGECGQQKGAGFDVFNAIFVCSTSPASSICHGDSGSGVVTAGANPVLVGLVDDVLPGCHPGSHNIYVYAGAGEILDFINGNDKPPTAPRPLAWNSWKLTWKPPLVVGSTLICFAGRWPGPVRTAYTFLNAVNGHILQTGSRATYVALPKDVGATIECDPAVRNSGGTMLVKTLTTFKVKPAPRARSNG